MRHGRIVKWLIIGLEVPFLSIVGLFIGLRLSGDQFDLSGLMGMVVGSTLGLMAGSLILYVIALRTYNKDKHAVSGKTSSSSRSE